MFASWLGACVGRKAPLPLSPAPALENTEMNGDRIDGSDESPSPPTISSHDSCVQAFTARQFNESRTLASSEEGRGGSEKALARALELGVWSFCNPVPSQCIWGN